MGSLVDSKTKGDSKEMKDLHESFKAIAVAAIACTNDLDTKSDIMKKNLSPLLKFNINNPNNFFKTSGKTHVENNINNLISDAYSAYDHKDKKLFRLIDQAKKDMKKIKAASK